MEGKSHLDPLNQHSLIVVPACLLYQTSTNAHHTATTATALAMLRAHIDDAVFRQSPAADASEVVRASTPLPPQLIPLARNLHVTCGVEERARERRAMPDGPLDKADETLGRILRVAMGTSVPVLPESRNMLLAELRCLAN